MKKALELAVLLVALAVSTGTCQQASSPSSAPREVLKSSTDREALEHAARTLARSEDAGDLALLGQLLREREFLARLDDLSKPESLHLSRVIAALAEHPTPQAVELCLSLAEDPVFVAEADRKSFVLELLASVKPMAERTAAVLQRSNAEGYFEFATCQANRHQPARGMVYAPTASRGLQFAGQHRQTQGHYRD